MVSTVEFDDQMLGRTKEVDNIRTDRCLPPEMRAINREFFERSPQNTLMRRRVGSKLLGCRSPDRC